MDYAATNPRTGARVGPAFAKTSQAELGRVLDRAVASQAQWSQSELSERVAFCRQVGRLLRSRKIDLAAAATEEMGKLSHEALAEVEKCAVLCHYYADQLPAMKRSRKEVMPGAIAYVHYAPLGLILGIMPWNFPYWQAIRFAIPAIAAGNVALLKHAANVPRCAELLTEVLAACGLPQLLHNIRLDNAGTEALIADHRVAGVSLTGSTAAGQAVGAAAGAVLKPSVLELGGSDPYLILADADLDVAAAACFAGRRLNSGQSCISAKRLIVDQSVEPAYTKLLLAKVKELVFAPTSATSDREHHLAPLARHDLRERLHEQITQSVALGAELITGGVLPATPGYYYPATLLTDVEPGMPAFDEELFGPVFVVIRANDTEEAITLANTSPFGLGAAVFSRDLAQAEQIAATRIHAGACFVNEAVRSDPRLPFGGVGQSGYGRELAVEGYRAFCNTKTVYIAHPS